MEALSRNIIDFMLNNGIISEQDEEVYLFGLVSMLRVLANIFTLICIGTLFNMVGESIVFIVFSLLIRSYSGGFHSDIPIVCYLISIVNIILMLLCIKFQILNFYTSFILTVASIAVILKYAPIEHRYKPLEKIERKIYKKKLVRIVAILNLFMLLFVLLDYKPFLYASSFSFGVSAFMILFAMKGELFYEKF